MKNDGHDLWSCFFNAEPMVPHINSSLFILNSSLEHPEAIEEDEADEDWG
jgi:hypothetical protein